MALRLLLRGAAVAALLLTAGETRATCEDGVQDGPESDVDCGGDCQLCDHGYACRTARDCRSGRCADHVCEERAYVEGDPIPPGYRVITSESDSSAMLKTLGLVTFGVGYGAAWASALALPGELSVLYVPVAGPWMAVADAATPKPGLVAIDAALQTVGFSLLVGGLLTSGSQLVRTREAPDVQVSASAGGAAGYRLNVSGRF